MTEFTHRTRPAIREGAEWTGKLIRDGIFTELSASSRDLLLAAAAQQRTLTQTPSTLTLGKRPPLG